MNYAKLNQLEEKSDEVKLAVINTKDYSCHLDYLLQRQNNSLEILVELNDKFRFSEAFEKTFELVDEFEICMSSGGAYSVTEKIHIFSPGKNAATWLKDVKLDTRAKLYDSINKYIMHLTKIALKEILGACKTIGGEDE